MEKDMQVDSDSDQDEASNSFTFSRPSPITSPEKVFNAGNHSEPSFESSNAVQNYAFAAPDPILSPERAVNIGNHSHTAVESIITQKSDIALPLLEREDNSDERITSTKTIEAIKREKLLLSLQNLKKSKSTKPLITPKDVKKTKAPKSPLSAHDIKKTDAFIQLEKNTKKTKDVKLELSKSITCQNVPELLLEKRSAQQYFEQFGEVLRVTPRPKRKMITVYFSTVQAAEKAFLKAKSYMGHEFTTAWTTSEMLSVKQKKAETPRSRIASFLNLDDEVKEELEAMKGLEYNLPEVKNVTTLNNFAAKAVKKAKELKASRDVPKRIIKPLIRAAKPIESEKKVVIPKIETPKIDLNAKKILNISSSMIEEYQSQIRQATTTSEEKYKVLEARDRLMRLKQDKQQNLATAKVIKGTCLDMCPEKERYMRESQRTLSSYEQMECNEYKINHSVAVKQYSRSSADQEEPMPHDLRPVKSLKMTMSYLLHEICDLCENDDESLTEWYHFLWDRMRSIRKDITLQQLCCKDTVELVEQCARFHIVASERLCSEELSVFDPQINSENLTKCLQTLKYMYYDLREHGIVCKNEPEFQAYVILLNLNNGSFIADLRTLPAIVQQSPEIKFALSVYSALGMDNYCRFFKLVRNTTYLNACILLRYFNQVREKALTIMVKAYCRSSANTEYPLYEMVDILGFEGPDELLYFCSKVGLRCDDESLYIKLNKDAFHSPKSNIEQNRALNVVLSKRLLKNQNIGQCIAGGVLPEKSYERHKPHCSFNSRGYLLPSSYDAKDQSLSDPYKFEDNDDDVQFVSEQREVKTTPNFKNNFEQKKPTNVSFKTLPKQDVFGKSQTSTQGAENKIFNNENSNIFASQSNSTSSIFAKPRVPVFSVIPTKPSTLPTNSPFNTIVNKSIFSGTNNQPNLFKIPSSPPSLKQDKNIVSNDRVSIKRRLDEPDIAIEKKSYTESQDLLKKKIEAEEKQRAEAKRIAEEKQKIEEKLKIEQEKLRRLEKLNKLSLLEYNLLEMEVIEEECSLIVQAELNRINMINSLTEKIYDTMLDGILKSILDEQLFIQDMLIEVEHRLQDKLILKYYRIWKLWASRRRAQRREALDNTPVWLQPESLQDRARKLYTPQQKIAIEHARELKRRSRELEAEKKEKKSKQTSVEFIITVGLKENSKSFEIEPNYQHIFWKLVISWPSLDNKNLTLWRHKNLVNKYLSPEDSTLETVLIQHKPSPQERLDICIRHFEGLLCENCLTGTDGLLFILSADEDARFIERRLTKSILSREKLMPIPVVILVFGDDTMNPNVIKPSSVIENLLESGHVSEYSILYERSTDEEVVLKMIQTAILWLAINRSPIVPLEMNYLKNVFDDCLTEELWLKIQSQLSQKPQFSRALCDPNFVINLHNEAVNHIIDIILDVESMSYTDFAPELKIFIGNKCTYPCTYEHFDNVWKHPEYRAELERIMSSFVFPPWRDAWPILDMLELNEALLRYCRQLLPIEDSVTITDDIMADLFLIVGPNENNCPSFTDVIIHIMRRKICDIGGNTRVVYNKNHIKHFQTLPWWFKSPTLSIYATQHEGEYESFENETATEKQMSTLNPELETDFELMSIDELNQTYEQLDTDIPVANVCEEMSTRASTVRCATDEIDKQLEEYRKRSESLEAKLKAALQEGTEFSES